METINISNNVSRKIKFHIGFFFKLMSYYSFRMSFRQRQTNSTIRNSGTKNCESEFLTIMGCIFLSPNVDLLYKKIYQELFS